MVGWHGTASFVSHSTEEFVRYITEHHRGNVDYLNKCDDEKRKKFVELLTKVTDEKFFSKGNPITAEYTIVVCWK